jgi:hypothetical protein
LTVKVTRSIEIVNGLLASVLALATIHTLPAQTVIRIAGSTAYLAAVYQAIAKILRSPMVIAAALQVRLAKLFTPKTSNLPVIKTLFSGSVGGISTLAAKR